MLETAYDFLIYYQRGLIHAWETLGPMEYGTLLTTIGVLGWWSMRVNKRN